MANNSNNVEPVWTASLKSLCFLSLNLCLDYSLSSISLEAYFVSLGGDDNWVGFVFGCYDALTIIIAPLTGIIVGKWKFTSFCNLFKLSVLLNLIGNLIYSLGGLTNNWMYILLGRLIAGCGASFLPLIMVYISICTKKQDQREVVGYIKYSAALARIMGPIIATIVVISPASINNNTIINKIFNVYTYPGWIAVIFNIITLILIILYVKNPQIVDETGSYGAIQSDDVNNNDTHLIVMIRYFLPLYIIGFLVTFCYWMCMGNGYLISFIYYRMIHKSSDLWKIYISGLFGFIIAFIIFFKWRQYIEPRKLLIIALLLIMIGLICLIFNQSEWFYYIGVGIATLGYGFVIPSINIVTNLLIKNQNSIIGSHRGLIVSLLSVFQAIGRFLGPSTLTWIVNTNNGYNGCDMENYINKNCKINYYVLTLVIVFAIAFSTIVVLIILMYHVINISTIKAPKSYESNETDIRKSQLVTVEVED